MPRVDISEWTFGCEHELADWTILNGLPEGHARSPDYTIVNSNGVAAQPNPNVYSYGGEINTPPTDSIMGQVGYLAAILDLHPNAAVNHRSNLHIHIRVPGLKEDLLRLKILQEYIHTQLPFFIDLLEPIPQGVTLAEKKREKRRKVSHHTFLTEKRWKKQMDATTIKDFFEAEVPRSKKGQVMWHAQPRVCVNLRQLMQTNTVEFRHFPGTLGQLKLQTCLEWCREFMIAALEQTPLMSTWLAHSEKQFPEFPSFPSFNEERERGYQATASHNELSQAEIKENIQLILEGKFNVSHKAYIKAAARACGLPWEHLP